MNKTKLTNLCNGSRLYGLVAFKSPMPLLFSRSTFFTGLAADDTEEDEGVAPPIGELLGVVSLVVISAPITALLAMSAVST